jgi:glycine cleavage system H protein
MKKYTKTHEWIEVNGTEGIIGISQHAADELGDVVFVELPAAEKSFAESDVLAVVESVKAASDVYAPVSCEVLSVNEKLSSMPDSVNRDAEGEGWFAKVKVLNEQELDALMNEDEYQKFLSEEH